MITELCKARHDFDINMCRMMQTGKTAAKEAAAANIGMKRMQVQLQAEQKWGAKTMTAERETS